MSSIYKTIKYVIKKDGNITRKFSFSPATYEYYDCKLINLISKIYKMADMYISDLFDTIPFNLSYMPKIIQYSKSIHLKLSETTTYVFVIKKIN